MLQFSEQLSGKCCKFILIFYNIIIIIFLLNRASLCSSTLSVGFNSTSVVVLEDFVKGCFGMKPSDRCSFIFVKCLVVLLGCIAIGLLFLVEKLGGVLVVSILSINIFIN